MSVLFDDGSRGATLSEDRRYRWTLWRRWDDGPALGWVMLNPSTADALTDDQTVHNCCSIARRHGYAGIVVVNLFAFRTPKPTELKRAWAAGVDVVGPENDARLAELAGDRFGVRDVVLAWGAIQRWAEPRRDTVEQLLAEHGRRSTLNLGRTQGGHPRHPARMSPRTELRTEVPI